MSTFQYTITKYDNKTKTLDVSFGKDSGYAKITLMTPLPSNIDELELIIRQYVLPQEYVDALNSPTDMSYIDQYVGHTRSCERRSLQTTIVIPEENANKNWDIDNPYDNSAEQLVNNIEDDIINSQNEFTEAVNSILRKNGLIK